MKTKTIKLKLDDPSQLEAGDKLGYFSYSGRIGGSYKFYQTCGLRWADLHRQTVNWLLSFVEVERVVEVK